MSSNAQAVKDKLKSVSKNKNIYFNSILRFYMYDRFIERLSKSKYRDNFILKGGFYLSHLFGIDNRSTMDIDSSIRNTNFTKENIIYMINEIINIDLEDNVVFKIDKIESIMGEDVYGGLRISIIFQLEKMHDKFNIDLATGDPIYPGPINYKYESLIGNDVYRVWTYNLETTLAEKIETILSKLETSSRMKDYYDIYYIYNFKFDKIDINAFQGAIKKTFSKRNFNGDLIFNLNVIKKSKLLKKKWIYYSKNNNYASNISFNDVISSLEKIINMLI